MKYTFNLSLHSHPKLYSSYLDLESAFYSNFYIHWEMRTQVEWRVEKVWKLSFKIPCLLVEPNENFKGSNGKTQCANVGSFLYIKKNAWILSVLPSKGVSRLGPYVVSVNSSNDRRSTWYIWIWWWSILRLSH